MGMFPAYKTILKENFAEITKVDMVSLSKPRQTDKFMDSRQRVNEIIKNYSFYDYVLNLELKYFSNLLAKPKSIFLRSTDTEKFFQRSTYPFNSGKRPQRCTLPGTGYREQATFLCRTVE